jgi:streptogramin lyase
MGRTDRQPGADEKTLEYMRQWASSADASSEYDNPDWAAEQATGAPDTLECGDTPTAWASLDKYSVAWLEVRFEIPVLPSEVNIYESHTPSQVVSVEILDDEGNYHQVYSGEPKLVEDCPYILSIAVEEDVDYQAVGVKITVDQSQLGMPWDEIDAVELIGYGDPTEGQAPIQSDEPSEPMEPSEPSSADESTGELPSGNWITYSTENGLSNEEIHAVAVGKDGTVWVASGPFGKQILARLENGTFSEYNPAADGSPVTVTHYGLIVAPDGTLWAATGTKLARFKGGEWRFFTKEEGLLDDQIKSVALAADGTLWVGSVAGVSRFDGSTWTNFTPDDGLIDTFIEAIAIDDGDNPWFVSSFGGASHLDGKKWSSFAEGKELPDYPHSSVALGPEGDVWIGSGGGGVSRYDGSDWTTYTITADFDLEYVKAIIQAPDGAVWFGTEGEGAYRFDGQTWTNYTKADGLCYDYVDSIAAGPDGSIWFGCRKNGLSQLKP